MRVQAVPEIDPGLRFVIGRRQWIDLSVEETFVSKSEELIDVLRNTIGEGRGIEGLVAMFMLVCLADC